MIYLDIIRPFLETLNENIGSNCTRMEQIILKVRLPGAKTCFISNTETDCALVWEEDTIAIGLRSRNVYNDTKRQLGGALDKPASVAQLESLRRLRAFLQEKITADAAAADNHAFAEMARAIDELIRDGPRN